MTCFRYLLVAALFTTTCISSLFAQTGVPPWQPIGRYDYAPIRESSGLVTFRVGQPPAPLATGNRARRWLPQPHGRARSSGWGLFLRFNGPNNALKYAPKPE